MDNSNDDKIKTANNKVNEYLKILSKYELSIKDYQALSTQQKMEFDKNRAEIKFESQKWAISELEKYKTTELESIKKMLDSNAVSAAANLLQKWKIESEAKIRQDAINRSYGVNMGLVKETLLPFHKSFPYNPKDTKFIGNPVDLVVFDGIDEGKDDITIYFVEIKTGKSRLSVKQQKIKSAVLNERIRWHEINVDAN